MTLNEKIFEKKNLVPWDPPGVLRVPILGPNRGMFSKLNGPSPRTASTPVSALADFWLNGTASGVMCQLMKG